MRAAGVQAGEIVKISNMAMKYSVIAAGPPLKTGDVIQAGLSAQDALLVLRETKSRKGPAYVCDEFGGIVGPHELERRSQGKEPKLLP